MGQNCRENEKRKDGTGKKGGRRVKKTGGAASLALFAGVCAGAGAMAGAANYVYDHALVSARRVLPEAQDQPGDEFDAGRRWMRRHPMREDVYIRADDGLWLHANFIPAGPDPRRKKDEARSGLYALCVHGYKDASDTMGIYGRAYRDRYGMNVLFPDLRGHGKSDGSYIGMGYHDSMDLLRWIDWILEKDPDAQIILHGISMGAATVLMTTGRRLPSQVLAAVADSSYTSALEIFGHVYEMEGDAVAAARARRLRRASEKAAAKAAETGAVRIGIAELGKCCRRLVLLLNGIHLPAPILMEAVRAVALVRAGYDMAKASPVRAVARSQTPTLFIHGQADSFVPPDMMPVLYEAASCPKAFLWIPGADHVGSVLVDPETYWAKIERFLHAQGFAP